MSKRKRYDDQPSDSATPGLGELAAAVAERGPGTGLPDGNGTAKVRRCSGCSSAVPVDAERCPTCGADENGVNPAVTLKKISVEVIPHGDHRYATVGDWFEAEDGEWVIRVSDTGDWRHALLVAVHEIIEMSLCKHRGIPEQTVMDFDLAFEEAREPGNDQEPGDDVRSPYRKEHVYATFVERHLAAQLNVNWKDYENKLDSL